MRIGNPWSEEDAAIERIDSRRRLVGGMKRLRQLPPGQRDAYLYVRVLGYTEREAGTILGLSRLKIHRLLHQALTAIQARAMNKK
jgi:DNA-directed RNA polymerase specialized sigma24 family protein